LQVEVAFVRGWVGGVLPPLRSLRSLRVTLAKDGHLRLWSRWRSPLRIRPPGAVQLDAAAIVKNYRNAEAIWTASAGDADPPRGSSEPW